MWNRRLLVTLFFGLFMPFLGCNGTGTGAGPETENQGQIWLEDWEKAATASYKPDETIKGTAGEWWVHDTISSFDDCGTTPHRAEVISQDNGKILKLVSIESGTSCADNIWVATQDISIPLEPGIMVTFSGTSDINSPGKGHKVRLVIQDNPRNGKPASSVAYLLQDGQESTPQDLPYYKEFLIDSGQDGVYTRDVFKDFMEVLNFVAEGAQISTLAFELGGPGSATIDDIFISK